MSPRTARSIRRGLLLARQVSRRERLMSRDSEARLPPKTLEAYRRERSAISRRLGPPRGSAGVSRPSFQS